MRWLSLSISHTQFWNVGCFFGVADKDVRLPCLNGAFVVAEFHKESMMRGLRTFVSFGFVCILFLGLAGSAFGDSLHSCYGTPSLTCNDTGVMNPVNSSTPTLTFTDSSGPATGDFWIIALIPNNEDPGPLGSFTVNVTDGGATNTSTFSDPANLFSPTAWMSSDLATYLGIGANPTNPIGNYLPCAQTGKTGGSNCGTGGPYVADPGATGFYVYKADLGTNQLAANGGGATGNPQITFSVPLPQDSFVVGFLSSGGGYTATASSGSLFINASGGPLTPTPTPEPSSLMLLGTGLAGLAAWVRKRVKA